MDLTQLIITGSTFDLLRNIATQCCIFWQNFTNLFDKTHHPSLATQTDTIFTNVNIKNTFISFTYWVFTLLTFHRCNLMAKNFFSHRTYRLTFDLTPKQLHLRCQSLLLTNRKRSRAFQSFRGWHISLLDVINSAWWTHNSNSRWPTWMTQCLHTPWRHSKRNLSLNYTWTISFNISCQSMSTHSSRISLFKYKWSSEMFWLCSDHTRLDSGRRSLISNMAFAASTICLETVRHQSVSLWKENINLIKFNINCLTMRIMHMHSW